MEMVGSHDENWRSTVETHQPRDDTNVQLYLIDIISPEKKSASLRLPVLNQCKELNGAWRAKASFVFSVVLALLTTILLYEAGLSEQRLVFKFLLRQS